MLSAEPVKYSAVTGPLGQGIRMQTLALRTQKFKHHYTPAHRGFDAYELFTDLAAGTLEPSSTKEVVLETLRRGERYRNVIGLTMYNEGQEELLFSLKGIWRNLRTARRKGRAFKRPLVVILVDGYAELHKKAALLAALESSYKLYSKSVVEEALQQYAGQKKVWDFQYTQDLEATKHADSQNPQQVPVAHRDIAFAFETRLTMGTSDLYAVSEDTEDKPALDVLLVVKAENLKKLHSHLWLFYGFCMLLKPDYVYLLDVGTEPMKKSLLALSDHFERNPSTGGCCGEIIVKNAPWYDPLVGAQWFEYKVSHIIYKTFESLMGFIPVLPGAFSAYRWAALTADNCKVLKAYLLPFTQPLDLDWTLTNIYFLAEDRIMSQEIMRLGTKPSYLLRFVKGAKALTEGQDEFVKLIQQRRRWINGSWFALIKVLRKGQLLRDVCFHSQHSPVQKVLFVFQNLYMLIVMLMTWFSVGIFFTGYALIVEQLLCKDDTTKAGDITEVCGMFLYAYLFVMGCNVVVALATSPENVKPFWIGLCWFFSGTGVFMLWGMIQLIVQQEIELSNVAVYEAAGLFLIIGLAILCYWDNFCTMLVFGLHYLLLSPTYINILTVFALCKTDDLSWGTRGPDSKTNNKQDEFNKKKTFFLVFFIGCNLLLGGLVQR